MNLTLRCNHYRHFSWDSRPCMDCRRTCNSRRRSDSRLYSSQNLKFQKQIQKAIIWYEKIKRLKVMTFFLSSDVFSAFNWSVCCCTASIWACVESRSWQWFISSTFCDASGLTWNKPFLMFENNLRQSIVLHLIGLVLFRLLQIDAKSRVLDFKSEFL